MPGGPVQAGSFAVEPRSRHLLYVHRNGCGGTKEEIECNISMLYGTIGGTDTSRS